MKTPIAAASLVLVACASSSRAPTSAPAGALESAPAPASAPARESHPASASALFAAIAADDPARIDHLLAADPALVDATDPKGTSAVIASMFLLKGGESFYPPRRNAPLQAILARRPTLDRFLVAAFGDTPRVEQEIRHDPTYVRARHGLGWAPLHFAAFADNASTARALLDAGADVNAVAENTFRNTPLQVTTLTGSVEVARLLIARGADVKHRQEGGFTALHGAVESGSRDMVLALLDAGADPHAAAENGKTPLDLARTRSDGAIVALLEERIRP